VVVSVLSFIYYFLSFIFTVCFPLCPLHSPVLMIDIDFKNVVIQVIGDFEILMLQAF
jgi:hypothetical protein